MSIRRVALLLLCVSLIAFAQSDRGTITGAVSDPAGAVVANAPIQARNVETGAVFEGATSATGNYTLAQLPPGTYEVSVAVQGFKKYTRSGLDIQVAQTARIDITLEVGATSESVTVNEAAPLLKTETGDLSHNVTTDFLDQLPLYPNAGYRSMYNVVQLLPGVYQSVQELRISGAPNNTQSVRVEGQEANNSDSPATPGQTQQSVDSIQEVTVQTSNYAAEYGQAGGGVINMTMKSGTNQFHGSGFDYIANEVFNAGRPYNTNNPAGNPRDRLRRHDYGFTIGGPAWIPKIYDGHNKTFFFFNREESRATQTFSGDAVKTSVPTAAYRAGDFATAIAKNARVVGTDPLGRQMLEGMIYDPATTRTDAATGRVFRDQFPNNRITDTSRFDPIALKMQALIPQPLGPNAANFIDNFQPRFSGTSTTGSYAFKIDQTVGSKGKLAFYYSHLNTHNPISTGNGQADGLPDPIGAYVCTCLPAYTIRLNYDHTLTPSTLLHLGAGYFGDHFYVPSVTTKGDPIQYDASKELGLKGAIVNRFFPQIQGLLSSTGGGMKNFGSSSGNTRNTQRPTFNVSVTMVRGNHTYKTGAELKVEGYPVEAFSGTTGTYGFGQTLATAGTGSSQTGQPFQQTAVAGANVGFGYASFLLGLVNNVSISNPTFPKIGKNQTGLYVQDSWKITRKFTLDYGLRYDYSTYLREQYGRAPFFSATALNPGLGNIPGAAVFDRSGPGHCNCDLAKVYPWAFGPRLGFAYQLNPKTVLRGGVAIVYNGTEQGDGYTSGFAGSTAAVSTPTFGTALSQLANGYPTQFYPKAWPNYDPGQFPTTTTPQAYTVGQLDQNAGRPARQYQWSFGVQRELAKDVVVEAEYVGNRGIWWISNGLVSPNAISLDRLKQFGIDPSKPADITLLTSQIGSAAAVQRGIKLPYVGFPTTQLVAQALRPFPQYTTLNTVWAPVGNTWYDSLQTKVTKRFSHGLSVLGTFSWSKTLTVGVEREPNPNTTGNATYNDVFNRSTNKTISLYDSPFQSSISVSYVTPSAWKGNKIVSWITKDWSYGMVLQYRAGLPMGVPAATGGTSLNSLLFQTTLANRVAGQPLFNVDLNCHCFDPQKVYALNANAWAQPTPGTFGVSNPYYSDYRKQRHPSENVSFGRTFRITEKANFNVRMDYTNVFNRGIFSDPRNNDLNEAKSLLPNGNTNPNSGFGAINATTTPNGAGFAAVFSILPRQGVIVGRLTF